MYGSKKSAASSQVAPTPPVTRPAPSGSARSSDAATFTTFPWVLLTAVGLYFVWAIVEQHQKIKAAIQPHAIGINLRNLAVILTTVILGLNLFKVFAVKLSAFLGRVTGGRIRVRWLVYLAGGA